MSQIRSYELTQAELDERTFISQVYLWMTTALVVTAVVAAAVATDLNFVLSMFSSGLIWIFFIAEIGLVVVLGAAINRLSAPVATAIFFGYAALNGLTLSVIFWAYTDASIVSTFMVTAVTFGVMSLYGYTTRRDLTSIGNLLLMGLIGFLIASVVNLFLRSEAIYWIVTYAGILIFVGLTAYDTQKIKRMAASGFADGEVARKASILGALRLYLDFINLFLLLLRVMGRRR
jgi:FtsH-binding integral membrane protein